MSHSFDGRGKGAGQGPRGVEATLTLNCRVDEGRSFPARRELQKGRGAPRKRSQRQDAPIEGTRDTGKL